MSSPHVKFELAGRDAGWTECLDVILGSISHDRGFADDGVATLVADSGSCLFNLNNSRIEGLYSPDHANCLTGFTEGIGVQILIDAIPRWTGILENIVPIPGSNRERTVQCHAVGWMEIAATTKLSNLPVLVNKRADEIFQTLLDSLPDYALPRATEIDVCLDTYPYTLDRTRDEQTRLREELYRIALSGLDRFWERANGTVVCESRSRRFGVTTNVDTFTDHHGFTPVRGRDRIINHAQYTANPRLLGTVDSVMYSQNTPVALSPGNTQVILGPWTDSSNKDIRVGAVTLTALVSGTDYTANTLADGTGTDLTASLTITVGLSGNATEFSVTLGGSVSGWLTKLQQRGQPLLDYGATVMDYEDSASIVAVGDRPTSQNMPYQPSATLALEAAQYVVFTRKDGKTGVLGFRRIIPLGNPTELARSYNRDLGDRILITDAVSGISRPFFINRVRESIQEATLTTEWDLGIVDTTSYWYLEVVGKSELDTTTRLGFGYILGHTDIAHVDTHSDVAFVNVAHTDTHTDDAAISISHGDASSHGDTAAVNTAHSDVAHSDVAHDDAHADSPHYDTPHGDAHSDYHLDQSIYEHTDSHSDTHTDVTHIDEAPEYAHGDTAHSDVAHGDVAHSDVAHNDNSSHTDVGHTDVAHGDVAHADVTHGDVTHSDTHGDVLHGDVN